MIPTIKQFTCKCGNIIEVTIHWATGIHFIICQKCKKETKILSKELLKSNNDTRPKERKA
jgi:hypothetical protein